MIRAELLARLGRASFDLLIIGGGIVGAGVARDAALRGLKVALIEQGDFASGTSSKTSKLIHGGLRYLEHGQVSLVRESLRERRILRTSAPTLVEPLSLLLPIFEQDARPPWKIRLGLGVYGWLAGGDPWRATGMVSPRRAVTLEPSLRVRGLRSAGLYTDGLMDDARLCLANILQAVDLGAVCCNYVRLRAFLRAGGRLCGGIGEDLLSGRSCEVQATVVVNATGPWGDRLRRMSDPNATVRLAPTKGSHLVLRRVIRHGLFVQARSDRRMLFVLPWGDLTLVGTTERPVDESLEALRATRDEVDYLLEEVNRVLPEARLTDADIVGTFAGARPLLTFRGSAGAASREHRIEVDRGGLVSVLGGKYTTYRRMAQQTVEVLMRRQRWAVGRCRTDRLPLVEAPPPLASMLQGRPAHAIDAEVLGRLLARYGQSLSHILSLVAQDASLAQPLCPHHQVLRAELAHALRAELACSVSDLLVRRTRIALSACHGLDALPVMTDLMRRYGGWSDDRIEQQVTEYRADLERQSLPE